MLVFNGCSLSVAACISTEKMQTRRNLTNINPKNTKKSPIHENTNAKITCDFVDDRCRIAPHGSFAYGLYIDGSAAARMYAGTAAFRHCQLASISSSEKCCKCVIIHNITTNVCILSVFSMYLNIVYGCCSHIICIVK